MGPSTLVPRRYEGRLVLSPFAVRVVEFCNCLPCSLTGTLARLHRGRGQARRPAMCATTLRYCTRAQRMQALHGPVNSNSDRDGAAAPRGPGPGPGPAAPPTHAGGKTRIYFLVKRASAVQNAPACLNLPETNCSPCLGKSEMHPSPATRRRRLALTRAGRLGRHLGSAP